jgi:hypothetical protein
MRLCRRDTAPADVFMATAAKLSRAGAYAASPGMFPVIAPVLVQEPDHLLTRPVQVSA